MDEVMSEDSFLKILKLNENKSKGKEREIFKNFAIELIMIIRSIHNNINDLNFGIVKTHIENIDTKIRNTATELGVKLYD